MLVNKINDLIKEINKTVEKQSEANKLPDQTYYMDNGYILCCPRKYGESRFPYSCDGYTLWAHSSGYIHAKDGITTFLSKFI